MAMRLLVLMYHRARAGRHGNPPDMLDAHFGELARRTRNVMPGEPLDPRRLNVCVTFDDGTFDFCDVVFPLLRKHGLRALLAVPPRFVQERADASAAVRSALESDTAFAAPERGGFCTWPELKEMSASGHVQVAAHGFSHCRLDADNVDVAAEIDGAGDRIAARLERPVEAFVFPFGRFSRRTRDAALRRYRYVFRIGGAMNRNWSRRVLYRVDADRMATPTSLLSGGRVAAYRARYFWNRLRGR